MNLGPDACRCGCSESVSRRWSWIDGHDRRDDPVEKFWARTLRTATCWFWCGTVGPNGYGSITAGQRSHWVHRFAYELLVGPIPEGLQVDHLCRVTSCVNPDHLEAVTASENQRRAAALITHCPQGHEYTPDNMLVRRGERVHECAQCNREGALRRLHARKAAA